MRRFVLALLLAIVSAAPIARTANAGAQTAPEMHAPVVTVHYRSAKIQGLNVFYREAGPADAPVVLLLHGFPTSSHMFRNLIPQLADRYHVIAPDFPGFGQSDAPDHQDFKYGFGAYADIVDELVSGIGAQSYAMYVMDYGAPVGYRLALKHPDRVTALIIQNGNAYDEGLRELWEPIKAYWADGSSTHRDALSGLVTLEATKFLYTDGVSDVSRISPDNWVQDQALLDRPGNKDIQMDLFYDHRTNVPLYPAFQKYFRDRQPPTLIVWGKNDKVFSEEGARAYLRDLPKAEIHLLDTGHFALEDKLDEMVPLIRGFLDRELAKL
ncbi:MULTISPECIES: alpha/beta fold hydrolase [Rhizobium]|uniref:alpha/beta fold hydrolase n=1 Tax=Rhizobium TaxID=379 RepID=UPI00234ED256|nr:MULTISPECIES: alpha/beta hydrolase [unclassified Rhizobium]MDC7742576.1 alpha/beta fold hydrolase [Rhizobium sp. BC56]MDC9812004.1 alpha/beta fold hydrolase [Rhizobium sp. MC62]WEA27323.1 alpha/beta fold hydrolase [Rhizobium sp. MJ22]WEA61796.1 alpha/beta fold hydrolase [Rhizobium sp. BJ04]